MANIGRKDLWELLVANSREEPLKGMSDEVQADPACRTEFLNALDTDIRGQIASDIAEIVYEDADPAAFIEFLREGNLQAVDLVANLALNGGNSYLYSIGLDCTDDVKAAVIKELGKVLKELSDAPEDSAIMVVIANVTSSFIGNLKPEKSEELTLALAELTETIQGFEDTEANRVIASLFRLNQLVATTSKPETKTG